MMRCLISLLSVLMITGCSLAPEYQRPEMIIPPHYKELNITWLEANPDIIFDNGTVFSQHWWEMYHDPVLNALEKRINIDNQDLKLALARHDEASALLRVVQSGYFPMITGDGQIAREQTSRTVSNVETIPQFNNDFLEANLSYEVDLWGQVRNAVAVAAHQLQASSIQVATMRLSLQAQLATAYFDLRGLDKAQYVLDSTVNAYERAYLLRKERWKKGLDAADSYYQAKTVWENAKTRASDNRLQRAQLEHVIAVLMGVTPSALTIKPEISTAPLLVIHPELPSTLLERRPDVAAAERLVAAANAQIGVTRAAFFPSFNIVSTIGTQSAKITNFFNSPSLIWGVGANITQPIFEGGQLMGLNDQAFAQYDESVAIYRKTVLTAYQEVEDALVALHQLREENDSQHAAFSAADNALKKVNLQYKGGITTYLDVVIQENTVLQMELLLIDVNTRYHVETIQLIKALGGGWK